VSTPEHVHFAGEWGVDRAIRGQVPNRHGITAIREAIDQRTALPLIAAVDVRPGMAMLIEQGDYEVVASVEPTALQPR
jgi:hypothetical protein